MIAGKRLTGAGRWKHSCASPPSQQGMLLRSQDQKCQTISTDISISCRDFLPDFERLPLIAYPLMVRSYAICKGKRQVERETSPDLHLEEATPVASRVVRWVSVFSFALLGGWLGRGPLLIEASPSRQYRNCSGPGRIRFVCRQAKHRSSASRTPSSNP